MEEEEITITSADQRAAKKGLQAKKDEESIGAKKATTNKKRKQDAAQARKEEAAAAKKRVKFGDSNKARSWKASMKALREMETPTLNVTPEKGILLNKGKAVAIKTNRTKNNKSGRKKAKDYF